MRWLSYVPATANDLKPGMLAPADPVDRPVTARPPADGSPYDVRELLDNADGTGLFDKGSFTETLAGWGKTVVAGRAKLGGIPCLLYTSPSPRDQRGSRMPSSA